jgi:two-component system, OmpR family, sensor histidine kinase KdpD
LKSRKSRLAGVDIFDVKTSTQQAADRVATVLGPVLAFAVAWVSSRVASDISIANAALALAFVCVAAALVSPIAGFVTSVVAALALNYFHTTPVHSLRMTEPDEIVTVALLVLLGSSVSVATTMRVRAKVSLYRTDESLAATRELQELLSHGGALPAVWLTAVQSVCVQAGSIDVSLLSVAPSEVPIISRRLTSGTGSDGDTVVIPETGAALVLPNDRGALLLRPQAGLGAIMAARRMLLQFGDQLALALDDADQKRSAA